MSDIQLHFQTAENDESGHYRLLELPPELFAIDLDKQRPRGRSTDDAVLCTVDKTYNVRSVTLSNSFCVITPPRGGESGDAVIRDNVQEILELTPSVPKLHRLGTLLRGCDYDEGIEQDEENEKEEGRPSKRMRYTYKDVKSELQASDHEFDHGLKQQHVLLINDHLRPISPTYLNGILELLLTTLASLSQNPSNASVVDLTETLENDHDVQRHVSTQVMSWFGEVTSDGSGRSHDSVWKMNIEAVVKQIGLGILSAHKEQPITRDQFLQKWRALVGDALESKVNMSLLLGNHLSHVDPLTDTPVITFFPSSVLPIVPAERFTDLFLTRSRWSAEDIAPFLRDIAVDGKERDKLLMMYTRSTTDKNGVVWYTARGGLAQ